MFAGRSRLKQNGRVAGRSRLQPYGKAALMRSKTYRASTMKEAMTRVRRDLGGDAVILSARRGAAAAAVWSGRAVRRWR